MMVMNITIRQFQIFEAAAQHLSYTRAAELLHLSQPAVSMQIKQLENEVQVPLFERIGKKLFLTEAGEELLIYARNILQQLTELDDVFNEIRGSEKGRLTIAVATTANYFSLKLLGEFYRRFSSTKISLDVTNRESLLKHLNDNTVDMVIMGQPPEGLDVEATSFLENALVVKDDKILNKEGLRNSKEFVNHKILDCMGDLYLLGYRILGKIVCTQGGHKLTNHLLREVLQDNNNFSIIEVREKTVPNTLINRNPLKSIA